MTKLDSPGLYWDGGPFRVRLQPLANMPQGLVNSAIADLESSPSDCQQQFCAFSGTVNGRTLAYERFKSVMTSTGNMVSVGAAFPDSEQRPGSSTIAEMRQGDLLDGLRPGGAFEDQHAKAFVVMLYHRWDEYFRHLIAQTLAVDKDRVQSDLMGDIRHVRNAIIHNNSGISQATIDSLRLLPQIWDLKLGALRLSERMLHSLMEQVNAIRVSIV